MQEVPSPKKHSILRIFIRFFLILLAFAILTVAMLPSLLSSSWGKEKITSIINQSIPGKVKVDQLELSWFGSQSLEGLSLSDPQNSTVLSLNSLKANTSLFRLLFHPLAATTIELKDLNTTIIGDSEGNTNLMRALNKQCCEIKAKNENAPLTISLKNTQALLDIAPKNGTVTLKVSGETEQNALKGQFNVDAEMLGIEMQEAIDKNGDLSSLLQSRPDAALKINADIVNFPVELLDQITALNSPKYAGLVKEVLGDALNLKIDQNATPSGLSFNLKAKSSTLVANAELLLDRELSLASPAKITLSISPSAVEKITKISKISTPWHLEAPTTATISITSLQIPLKDLKTSRNDLKSLGLNAELMLEQAHFIDKEKNEKLTIQGLQASISAEQNSDVATIKVLSEAIQKDQPTKINFNLTVPKPVLLGDLSTFSFKTVTLDGNAFGAPLAVLDEITKLPFSLIAGPSADLAFSLQMHDNQPVASLNLKSDRLEIPQLSFAIDERLTLQKPVQIVLGLNQGLVNHLLQDLGPQMQGPATAHLTVNSLSLPLSNFASSLKMMYRVGLDAQLKVTSMRLANVPKIGGMSVNDFSIRLSANPKNRPEIVASFSLQPDGPSILADLLGKKASFKTSASLGVNLEGKLTANVFNLEMLSELARVELSGEMHEGNRLMLYAPAMVSYTLTAAGLQSMGVAADNYLFQQGTPIEMTIDSSRIPMSLNDLSHLKLSGKLKVADFHLMKKSQAENTLAIIDNLTADWSIDGSAKEMTLDFIGLTRLGESQASGKINGSVAINHWMQNGSFDLQQAVIRVNANANKLPTELLSVISGQNHLVPLIGNAIDLSLEANASLSQAKNGILSIDIHSENLTGGLALSLGETIQLNPNRPAEFSLKLTPRGYAALRQSIRNSESDFTLTEPTTATLRLHALQFPRSGYAQSSVKSDFSLGRLVGMDTQTKNKITLNSTQGHIESTNLSEKIDFNMHATGQHENGNLTAWNMEGSIKNGFSPDGTINKENLSMSLDATVESLPIPLLCQLACLDPKLKQKIETVVGPKINAVIKTRLQQMNGPLFIEVNGQNGRFIVDANIAQGIMTLNQDLKAQLTVTPQLGEYVLKDLIPVLSGMLSAEQPINLTISKEGFAIPLQNPSSTNIAIQRAVLDMGKVHFSGESQIAKVLDLLTPATSNQLVWLTPAHFSLNQGLLKLERVDMLISDRYPLAAWGDVNFGKERVNMVIALAGAAISKAFNVPAISNSYLLQLPLTGKLSNPSIDRSRAIARISALVAQSQGGPQGLVIGTFLDIASGGLTENAVPSPTTNPLPWQDLMKDQPKAKDDGTNPSSEDKASGNPLKEIEKGASSILKKLFK